MSVTTAMWWYMLKSNTETGAVSRRKSAAFSKSSRFGASARMVVTMDTTFMSVGAILLNNFWNLVWPLGG